MVGLHGAAQQGSAAAPELEKKESQDTISQYDITLLVDQRNCLPPSMLSRYCSLAR